jgi:hypothetical protein
VVGARLVQVKTCESCGRTIEWRKKWADVWDEVRYCSGRCRRRRVSEVDRELETTILGLLAERAGGSTICPSEAARRYAGRAGREDWRSLMEPTRSAARRLVARGEVVIVQQGRVVDADRARGAIRIRRSPSAR